MIRKIVMIFRWIAFIGMLIVCVYLFQKNMYQNTGENVEITFMQAQDDADCTILRQGKNVVLIDTGLANNVEDTIGYLKQSGITKIAYLIITHPEQEKKDGTALILNTFQVEHIVQPIYQKENAQLDMINAHIEELKIPIIYPTRTRKFTVGDMKLVIYPPLKKRYEKDNDYSLAVLVKHQDVNMVFTGDSEKKRLKELLEIHWPKVDILKVPNHGSSCSVSEEFLKKVQSQYAVVTAGEADAIVRDTYEELNGKLLYSKENTIVFESNGEYVKIRGE